MDTHQLYQNHIEKKTFEKATLSDKQDVILNLYGDFAEEAKNQGLIDGFTFEDVPETPAYVEARRLRIRGIHSDIRIKNNGLFSKGAHALAAKAQGIILSHSGIPSPLRDFQVNFELDREDNSLIVFSRSMSPDVKHGAISGSHAKRAYWKAGEGSYLDILHRGSDGLEKTFTGLAKAVVNSQKTLTARVESIEVFLNSGSYVHEEYQSFKDRTCAL